MSGKWAKVSLVYLVSVGLETSDCLASAWEMSLALETGDCLASAWEMSPALCLSAETHARSVAAAASVAVVVVAEVGVVQSAVKVTNARAALLDPLLVEGKMSFARPRS